jgi:hypothetical protein
LFAPYTKTLGLILRRFELIHFCMCDDSLFSIFLSFYIAVFLFWFYSRFNKF